MKPVAAHLRYICGAPVSSGCHGKAVWFSVFMSLPVINHWKDLVFMLSSVPVCTHPCMFIYWKFVSMMSYKQLWKIHHVYNCGAVGDKDELIRLDFEVKRCRSQQAQMHFSTLTFHYQYQYNWLPGKFVPEMTYCVSSGTLNLAKLKPNGGILINILPLNMKPVIAVWQKNKYMFNISWLPTDVAGVCVLLLTAKVASQVPCSSAGPVEAAG